MFLTVNHFQIFKPGSVNGRGGTLQIQMRTDQKHQNNIKLCEKSLAVNDKRRHCAHQKHVKQQNDYYSTYSLGFLKKTLDVTPL